MKLQRIICGVGLGLFVLVSGGADASEQSFSDTVILELRQQGYTDITQRRTLLGRIRIVAQTDKDYREIVINPATSVILRDYWRKKSGTSPQPVILDPRTGTGATSSAVGTVSAAASHDEDDASDDSADDAEDDGMEDAEDGEDGTDEY